MKKETVKLSVDKIKQYFNKPLFDFYHKWEPIDVEIFHVFEKQ